MFIYIVDGISTTSPSKSPDLPYESPLFTTDDGSSSLPPGSRCARLFAVRQATDAPNRLESPVDCHHGGVF